MASKSTSAPKALVAVAAATFALFAAPSVAHAAGVRELVAHTGIRLLVEMGHELTALAGNLLASFWGEAFGHESAAHPCAGLAIWDLAALFVVGALVFAVVRVRNQTARKRLDVARRMVEQGMEPPGDLLGDTSAGDRRRGIVLVFAGLGLLVASWSGAGAHAPPSSAGLVPGFIGLGYLLSHWLSRGNERESAAGGLWRAFQAPAHGPPDEAPNGSGSGGIGEGEGSP